MKARYIVRIERTIFNKSQLVQTTHITVDGKWFAVVTWLLWRHRHHYSSEIKFIKPEYWRETKPHCFRQYNVRKNKRGPHKHGFKARTGTHKKSDFVEQNGDKQKTRQFNQTSTFLKSKPTTTTTRDKYSRHSNSFIQKKRASVRLTTRPRQCSWSSNATWRVPSWLRSEVSSSEFSVEWEMKPRSRVVPYSVACTYKNPFSKPKTVYTDEHTCTWGVMGV